MKDGIIHTVVGDGLIFDTLSAKKLMILPIKLSLIV